MLRRLNMLACLLTLAASLVPAQAPPQPSNVPLRLPPGLQQTLPLATSGSYFADAVKIQDCPEDKDNPNGLCNNVLFGGLAMYASPVSGSLHIRFSPPVDDIAHFEITHPGGLTGQDTVQRAPQLYQFPVNGTRIADSAAATSGDLNLITGDVSNLTYRVRVTNTLLDAYRRLNSKLDPAEIVFPGSYGSTVITRELNSLVVRFEQRADGLLDFTYTGSTFLPLGNNQGGPGGPPVRIPLPFCSAPGVCRGMEAPGTALHPRLRITTRASAQPDCSAACPEIPLNQTHVFTLSGYHTSTGDDFHLGIAALGGDAEGRSHLQGRLIVQFGEGGEYIPISVQAVLSEGLLAEPPAAPIPGFGLNMIGFDELLRFPGATYRPKGVAFSADPFDIAVGVINRRTGRFIGDFVMRGFPVQDLLFAVQDANAGKIPPDSFRYQGPASFDRGPNGALVFRFESGVFLNFSGLSFPPPDYNPAGAMPVGPTAVLNPFLNIQAVSGGPRAVVVKSDEIREASSFGDPITLRYAIPCDVANPSTSFVYVNDAAATRGGTFTLKTLASVNCASPLGSTAPPGEADMITFSGFGSWSKDSELHFAAVQIVNAGGVRYWAAQIDGGLLSNANNKPAQKPQP